MRVVCYTTCDSSSFNSQALNDPYAGLDPYGTTNGIPVIYEGEGSSATDPYSSYDPYAGLDPYGKQMGFL